MRTGAFPGVVAVGFCQTGAFRLLDIPLRPIEGKMPKSVSSVGGIYTYPEHSIETAEANQKLTEYTVAQEMVNFEQEIITHVRRFGMLRQQVVITEKNDEIALIRYQDAQESYLDREISITDLNIAMKEKDEAKKNYISALRDFWKSYYLLRQLTLYDFERDMPIRL